jgi:hypothetical protein
VFYHVPFAQPPTGDNRWRPPQPQPSPMWEGVRDATTPTQNTMCAQYDATTGDGLAAGSSEDCLYLNIYTPINGGEGLPGGLNADGSADSDALLPGHYMIQPLVELYGGCMVLLKVS